MNQLAAWPSAADLVGLPGMPGSRRGVGLRAAREGWASASEPVRGGQLVRFDPSCLPAETRLALAAQQAAGQTPCVQQALQLVDPATPQRIAGWLDAGADLVDGNARAAERAAKRRAVTAPLKEREAQRTRVLVLFQRWWQQVGGQLCPALQSFALTWSAGRIDAPDELRQAYPRLGWTTVRSWWLALQEKGTLARDPHPRRGQYAALSGQVGTATLAIIGSKPHLGAAATRRLLIKAGFAEAELPSERSFQRALDAFKKDNAAAWLAHVNPDAWRNKYLPADGDASAHCTAPNDEWQLDSTVGDCMLFDPETGEVRRHHIIACIDVFTRRVMFLVTRTSKAAAIMALLRRAIAAWGLPLAVKTDNGQDYVADALEFSLMQLGIEHRTCEPFQPQQKPFVERVIGTLLHDLFPLLTGFVGHNVAQRKAIESARSFADRLFPKKREDAGEVELRLSPLQLQRMVDNWTADYLAQEHSALGCSPIEHTQRHEKQVRRVDERALALFLLPIAADEIRQVKKKGVEFDRGFFTGDCLSGRDGEDVRVRMADDEIGRLHVFELDGAYIGPVEDNTRLGVGIKAVSAKRKAHAKRVNAELKDLLKAANRAFNTDKAVREIYLEREADAIDRAAPGSVLRLPPREQLVSTPVIDAALAGLDGRPVAEPSEAVKAAMRRLEGAPDTAPVFQVGNSPNARYSMFVRLTARVERGEALAPTEARWHQSYQASKEFPAMHRLHAGQDPIAADG